MADNPSNEQPMLRQLRALLSLQRRYDIGFPGARDLEFPELADLLTGQLLNNIGDPYERGHYRASTKALEQQVIDIVGDLLHAPPTRWGYVTTGSTEGTLHALDEAWQAFHGDLIVYTSTAAHYSVAKAARLLKLPLVMIRADDTGRMDTDDLETELGRRREHPAAIVATAGTTMTEAVDDVAAIAKVCDRLAVLRRRIHVDAALSGIPLALLPKDQQPAFTFAAGATSMVISGHKFLSTLMPSAVLLYAEPPYLVARQRIGYTGTADCTITGSRSGHTPLLLWHALTTIGIDGHRQRAEGARNLAAHAHQELREIGWEARLNPNAFTVVLRSPPKAVSDKWVLADEGRWAHIVCMPGITTDQIDEFVCDLAGAIDQGTEPESENQSAATASNAPAVPKVR